MLVLRRLRFACCLRANCSGRLAAVRGSALAAGGTASCAGGGGGGGSGGGCCCTPAPSTLTSSDISQPGSHTQHFFFTANLQFRNVFLFEDHSFSKFDRIYSLSAIMI